MSAPKSAELVEVERKLAERFGIPHDDTISERLTAIDRANQMVEDELVADWHALYAWWIEFQD